MVHAYILMAFHYKKGDKVSELKTSYDYIYIFDTTKT